jgi:ubiquinone/menaquinone biosynthesis C-methylase UbiE
MQSVIGAGWLGVDLSEAELTAARQRHGAAPLCRADAGALPFCQHSVDAVVCCMGLMVIPAVEATLREVTRVARRDGLIAVLVPAAGPLTARDRVRYARLLIALRITSFQYPNPEVVSDPARILEGAGLTVLDDASKRFAFPMADDASADLLVESLYLPHTAPRHIDAAKRLTRRWLQTDLGIPLRRLIATRA